jgi:phasin family protein
MVNAGGNKGKTERRGRKAELRKQAGGQQGFEAEPRPDQLQDAQEQINEQIGAPVASIDRLPDAQEQVNEQISAPVAWSDMSPLETSTTDIIPTVPAVSVEPVVASIATIANAYGAYTGKSVELTWSFLEKLAAVRSLDKAFEVQTEFAKQAFETFLAESRKIQELHSELARQRVVRLEGFVARITQTTFVLRATYP